MNSLFSDNNDHVDNRELTADAGASAGWRLVRVLALCEKRISEHSVDLTSASRSEKVAIDREPSGYAQWL